MRKLTLIILLALLVNNTKAQSWCAAGAQWHYRVYIPMQVWWYDGYLELNNTGTVTVAGKVCNNLVGTYNGIYGTPLAPTVSISYGSIQTYENNAVVYVYNNNTLVFDTLANFNANIGDKWLTINYPTPTTSTCNYPRPKITVIDTGHVIINSLSLKKLVVTHQLYLTTITDTIIEKIGTITNFLFPYYDCTIDGRPNGYFICYSDNNFPLYKKPGYTYPCNYYNIVGITELKNNDNNLNIYPNPANEMLNVKWDPSTGSGQGMGNGASPSTNSGFGSATNYQLTIINSLGQIIKEEEITFKNNVTSINTKELPNGVYYLKLKTENGLIISKRFVIAR